MRLLDAGSVPRFFIYELIQHHEAAAACLNLRLLVRLAHDFNSWSAVDTFASSLSGPSWRRGLIDTEQVARWVRSKNRWWRRAAVVSTVSLNNKTQGGTGDVSRTLKICSLVIGDRDDMVVKALSWALRELSKRDRKSVEEFITLHRSRLANRVIREVMNKLNTGIKNPKGMRKVMN